VLDDPEGGGRAAIDTDLGQIGGRRIERLAQLGLGHSRRQVTTDAHGVVVAGASTDQCLVVQLGHLDIPRADFDGALARHREEGMHGGEMGIVGTDIDQAGIGTGQ